MVLEGSDVRLLLQNDEGKAPSCLQKVLEVFLEEVYFKYLVAAFPHEEKDCWNTRVLSCLAPHEIDNLERKDCKCSSLDLLSILKVLLKNWYDINNPNDKHSIQNIFQIRQRDGILFRKALVEGKNEGRNGLIGHVSGDDNASPRKGDRETTNVYADILTICSILPLHRKPYKGKGKPIYNQKLIDEMYTFLSFMIDIGGKISETSRDGLEWDIHKLMSRKYDNGKVWGYTRWVHDSCSLTNKQTIDLSCPNGIMKPDNNISPQHTTSDISIKDVRTVICKFSSKSECVRYENKLFFPTKTSFESMNLDLGVYRCAVSEGVSENAFKYGPFDKDVEYFSGVWSDLLTKYYCNYGIIDSESVKYLSELWKEIEHKRNDERFHNELRHSKTCPELGMLDIHDRFDFNNYCIEHDGTAACFLGIELDFNNLCWNSLSIGDLTLLNIYDGRLSTEHPMFMSKSSQDALNQISTDCNINLNVDKSLKKKHGKITRDNIFIIVTKQLSDWIFNSHDSTSINGKIRELLEVISPASYNSNTSSQDIFHKLIMREQDRGCLDMDVNIFAYFIYFSNSDN